MMLGFDLNLDSPSAGEQWSDSLPHGLDTIHNFGLEFMASWLWMRASAAGALHWFQWQSQSVWDWPTSCGLVTQQRKQDNGFRVL